MLNLPKRQKVRHCGTLKLLIEQSGLLHLKDSIFFIGLLVIILKIR